MGSSRIFEWGWAAGILETLAYTGAISAEFCYPILDLTLTPQTAKTQREVAASPLTHVPPGRANLLHAAFVRKSNLCGVYISNFGITLAGIGSQKLHTQDR